MELKPLTKKQQSFAEENHDLVYAFLNKKNLPEDNFYDIVIFGYLRAVKKYCEDKERHHYKFSTLAWKEMRGSLSNYYRYLSSAKRNAPTVSLDEPIGGIDGPRLEEIISHTDDFMLELKEELLMHEMARKLPPRTMRIVRMKVQGAKMHDIAKAEKITFREINQLLQKIYPTVIDIFYGEGTEV